MSRPARSGVLVYAKDLARMARFYSAVLDAREVHADEAHRVLVNADAQIILHAMPPAIAAEILIHSPPLPREEQAIKPFFTVSSLAQAEETASAHGGMALGPIWPAPGMRVRNVCDPEGNIVHLREWV